MIELVKDWVRDLFIVVIALSFAEVAIPSGRMRKYLKFVFSIIIVGVVLSPISNLPFFDITALLSEQNHRQEGLEQEDHINKKENSTKKKYFQEDYYTENYYAETYSAELERIQNIQLRNVYEEKLADEVLSVIGEYYPEVKLYEVEIVFFEDEEKGNFESVGRIIIKGEETNEVDEIIRCTAQRIGIDEGKLSYINTEGE